MRLRSKYFILRHGQTIYQTRKKDFVYPPFPEKPAIKLTKKGTRQIKAAAKKLKKAGINLIFSSDFFRTMQTARIVAKWLSIKKINFDKRLRDGNLGIYRGGKKKEFYRVFPPNSHKFFYQRPPQGENWIDIQKRMVNFLKDIDKRYKDKTILIISHGDPLWLLDGAVKNWSIKKLLKVKVSRIDRIKVGEFRKLS